jgi:signal transduction histidine kinase
MEPEEVLEIVGEIRQSLFIGIPLALLFAGIAGLLAARKALQPLDIMTRSAADISADSLTERRLPIPRPTDELQALALAFNATLERLSAAFTRQRRFTADASHELRTPVTAILGHAELALSRPRTPAAYQETLQRIQNEAARMQRLIGRMLTLARAESGQQLLSFAPTDVSELLGTLTESLTLNSEATAVRLALYAPPAVTIVTDADSLTQVLLNLVENAIAYTEQGVVVLRLTVQTDHILIQVSDEGPGIDPAALALIFEPFYRADPSRQREQGGVGLGLALAHELTHLLGGHIEAANRPEGGAIFTVSLPLHPPPAEPTRSETV